MSRRDTPSRDASPDVGMCARCVHARTTTTARGSTFWRCARAEDDPRFARYPRLPVLACPGWTPPPPAR